MCSNSVTFSEEIYPLKAKQHEIGSLMAGEEKINFYLSANFLNYPRCIYLWLYCDALQKLCKSRISSCIRNNLKFIAKAVFTEAQTLAPSTGHYSNAVKRRNGKHKKITMTLLSSAAKAKVMPPSPLISLE
jgi:hypothetical protein